VTLVITSTWYWRMGLRRRSHMWNKW